MIVNCKNCQKEFKKSLTEFKRSKNHFCSRSCAAKFNNKNIKRNKPSSKTITKYSSCSTCNTSLDYRLRRTKCNNCLQPDYTLADIQYDKHHKSSTWALVRSRAKSIIQNRPQVCERCGYNKHVECCHIKSISSFSLESKLSEVNHPDNLILLCPNCHWEFDNGLYQL